MSSFRGCSWRLAFGIVAFVKRGCPTTYPKEENCHTIVARRADLALSAVLN
jgi:hypothetical protein